MAKQSKGRKFGRNRDRNPASRLQKMRTDKNKRLAIERAMAVNPKGVGHVCPKHPDKPAEPDRMVMAHLVPNLSAKARAVFEYVKGVCVDVHYR